MENCKDLDKLFGNNGIVVSFDNILSFTEDYRRENYFFDGEQLMLCNGERSKIKYIFAYQDGEFTRLYKAPTPRPIIQTGDFIRNHRGLIGVVVDGFIYYMDGGFDLLSSVAKLDYYIEEIRRPSKEVHSYGFGGYAGMPVIWPEKN